MKNIRSKKQVALLIIFSLMIGFATPVLSTDTAKAAEEVYGDTLSKLKKNTLSIGKKKTFTTTYKTYTKIHSKKGKLVKGGIYKKAKKIKVKHTIKVGGENLNHPVIIIK